MYNAKFPFTLLVGRSRQLIQGLEARLSRGEINTRAGFLIQLLQASDQFLAGVLTPSLQVPRIGKDDLLIREEIEEPVDQASVDVRLADEQLAVLRDLSLQIFNLCQAERLGLSQRLLEVTSLTDAFRLWVSDSDPNFIWCGDTFNDLSKVDPSSSAFVDPRTGTVTLRSDRNNSLTPFITAAFLDREISQGGLPGNNLEIRAPGKVAFTGDYPAPEPLLFQDLSPSPDQLVNIWDGQPDTWFEWERYFIPVPQRTIQAGNAFVYDPSGKPNRRIPKLANWRCYLQWPGDPQVDTGLRRKGHPIAFFKETDRRPLRLGIEVILDEPRVVSWIQLTPLVHAGKYPIVEQIIISNDGENWRPLLREPTTLHPRMNRGIDFTRLGLSTSNFEGIGIWTLPNVPVRYVKVILRQDQEYECPLGVSHTFYIKQGKRAKGPILVFGSPNAVPREGQDLTDFADTPTKTKKRLKVRHDIFQGFRQAIGIRDLLLEERLFQPESQLLSLPFTLDRPVKAVSLLTTEQIPEEWGEGDWISYEVSADGNRWDALIPQRGELEESVVHFERPTRTLYFRATFTRPAEAENQSPVLLAYGLKALPA